ncbi:hypothetical protein [Gordonia sp. CPCC 205333]|uniref:hypothetical protein n=1 Tax=Gordonia sp. CPCC 205333 TaxID=3140790 RepID=UPI003AF364E2
MHLTACEATSDDSTDFRLSWATASAVLGKVDLSGPDGEAHAHNADNTTHTASSAQFGGIRLADDEVISILAAFALR